MILGLAARNLRRATWRTALAGAALALAAALLVVALALIEGLFSGMVCGVTRRGDGDAIVVQPSAGTGAGGNLAIADAAALGGRLRRLPGVAAASPRLRVPGVFLAGERRAAAEVLGIVPAAEAGVTDLQLLLVEGAPLPSGGESGVILGRTLAGRLGARTGDTVTLVARDAAGFPAAAKFVVNGVFATGDPRRDGTTALAAIGRLGALADLRGAAHEIGLAFAPGVESRRGAAAVAGHLPSGSGLVVLPWQTRLPALAEAVRFSRASSWWLIALFYAAAGLVVLIVLLLGAHERRREHAVCLALGTPAPLLRGVIAAEALLLGAGAVAVGSVLGAGAALALKSRGIDLGRFLEPVGYAGGTILPVLHPALRVDDLLRTGAALLAVCALAGYLAGRRLALLDPARVIAGRDEP